MFKTFLILLVSISVVLAVTAVPVVKPVPAPAAKQVPVKPSPTTLFVKSDTTLYFSANRDTIKMVKMDSTWITRHYIDSLFFVKADTVVRSSKPVFIKK